MSARQAAKPQSRTLYAAQLAWLVAQVECAEALWTWFESGVRHRAAANAAYRASLDREEAAARELQRLSAFIARTA